MVLRLLKQGGRTTRLLRPLALLVLSLGLFCVSGAYAQESAPSTAKPPYNIIFIIVDQRTYRLLAGPEYSLPAIDAIASHGVRFHLESDPEETHNLALQPQQHKDLMLRMNALLNDLVAKEVGENDGAFLRDVIHSK